MSAGRSRARPVPSGWRLVQQPVSCPMPTEPGSRGTLRVLFVEDSENDAALIVRHLERLGYLVEFFRVETQASFESAIANATWDVVISDHSMPQFSSMDALAVIRKHELDSPFIIVSGTIGEETA